MKVIRAVILIVVILGLTCLVFHISKLNDNIVSLEEEVEVQKVFVEQLEKDKKELTKEKNVLEVDMDALELDKSSLEKQLEEVQSKNLELERKLNSKENEVNRGASNSRNASATNSRGRLLGKFEATAYCKCTKCSGIWSGGPTASGTIPKEGRTIAVDPNVIPIGSKVSVDGKVYFAEDTGSAIKGNIIDVYYEEHSDALKFGRKKVVVKILN